ncbi:hypothetical protein A2U01_0040451, partial [Trifolium medium]|nr:hypothetical protein [Trifolium medium]
MKKEQGARKSVSGAALTSGKRIKKEQGARKSVSNDGECDGVEL